MKPLSVVIAFAMLAPPIVALAQEARPLAYLAEKASRQLIMPPLEYSKPYTGKILITRVRDKEQVITLCKITNKVNLACSFPRPDLDQCQIIMVPDEMIIAEGYIPALVIRHEMGHCWGWSAKHENSRVPTTTEIKDAIARVKP